MNEKHANVNVMNKHNKLLLIKELNKNAVSLNRANSVSAALKNTFRKPKHTIFNINCMHMKRT